MYTLRQIATYRILIVRGGDGVEVNGLSFRRKAYELLSNRMAFAGIQV